MCGEIPTGHFALTMTVHASSINDLQSIVLNQQLVNVKEVWLDEYQIVNFNGGVAGIAYLHLIANNTSFVPINNENMVGTALAVSPLQPHVVYSRPRVLLRSAGSQVSRFQLALAGPANAPITFSDALFVFTVIMADPVAMDPAVRAADVAREIPQIKGPDPRTIFRGDMVW